ncbi:hypothetical protein BD414DRAFT_480184 [Trametes punicea]|nr:hypothetical protein BD414DRAFT_480184 [Trametes punicea]
MQAYPAGDRFYHQQPPPGPYAGQAPYLQQFPAYGYPAPGPQQPIAAPFPVYPPHYDQLPPSTPHLQPGRPRPLARETSRTSTPGRPEPKPLKSAMKRTKTPDRGAPIGSVPSSRGRPDSIRRKRTRSGSRMRSGSVPRFQHDHLILTVRSTNHISLENLNNADLGDELTEGIMPIWPRGANSIENRRGKWHIEFAGNPWSSSGLDAIMAGKMICKLYLILARQGYTYLSTVNIGNPWKPPSMVFVDSTPDYEAQVFIIMLSKRGDRLTILDAPIELTQQLGIELRRVFPRRITTDRATEDGLHIFEVKKGSYGTPTVDKSVLIAFVLHFFNSAGFRLSGSIPMGSKSLFKLGHRKEMWIFRSLPWRPGAREDLRPESRASRRERGGQ